MISAEYFVVSSVLPQVIIHIYRFFEFLTKNHRFLLEKWYFASSKSQNPEHNELFLSNDSNGVEIIFLYSPFVYLSKK